MALRSILSVLWRHKWLMLAIIFVTMMAVPLRLLTTQDEFSGTIKLLITVPEQTTIPLLTGTRPSTAEDEINIARNNFVDVLESDETRRRVIEALNLPEPLHNYRLSVHVSRETDFLAVQITTTDSQWAAQIANEHVAQARQYFGEIRAQPAALAKLALAAQVSQADAELKEAELALVAFKNQYRITSIDAEQNLTLSTLERLYNERYQAELASSGGDLAGTFPELFERLDSMRLSAMSRNENARVAAWDEVISFVSLQIQQFTNDTSGTPVVDRLAAMIAELEQRRVAAEQAGRASTAESYGYVIAVYTGQLLTIRQANESLATINQAVEDQEASLAQHNELTPQYNELVVRVEQARANLRKLQDGYMDAVIKEDTALRADFIQVVLPASVAPRANYSGAIGLIALALVASLGVAIMLAFVAEMLGRWLWPAEPAPARPTTIVERPAAKTLERRHG